MKQWTEIDYYRRIREYLESQFDFDADDVAETLIEFENNLESALNQAETTLITADWPTLAKLGHLIKGMAANLDLKELTTSAINLEAAAKSELASDCRESVAAARGIAEAIRRSVDSAGAR